MLWFGAGMSATTPFHEEHVRAAADGLRQARAYSRRASDDQEQADRHVGEAALDLLEAMAGWIVSRP